MIFRKITENKRQYMDILLLADPQEDMIDCYLDTGDMFALYEGKELCTLAVVTLGENRECEIRNLVTTYGHGSQGYTRAMIHFLCEHYRKDCDTMYVGTWSYGESLRVYKKCGFEYSHTLPGYYQNNYDEPIYLDGSLITDKVYLKKPLEVHVDIAKVVNVAVNAGRILLKSGAEIFRVEETIYHICKRFHVDNIDSFVLSHGIFVSVSKDGEEVYTRVKHVPLSGTNLEVVAEVNDLSRRVSAGMMNLDEAEKELKRIDQLPVKKDSYMILASGLGAGTFGYLLGASAIESICAFFIGCILYVWVLFAGRHKFPKMITNTVGGFLITAMAVMIHTLGPDTIQIDGMIIASIMPLVPGMAFINALRDIADSDFLSGTVRMIDSLLGFIYIAVGTGVGLSIFSSWIGGLGV